MPNNEPRGARYVATGTFASWRYDGRVQHFCEIRNNGVRAFVVAWGFGLQWNVMN